MVLVDELRDAWRTESSDHRLTLAVILALGVALRGMYLTQPMRYDEAVTYMYFVRLPWAEALSTYTYPNNHLFHTLLAKLSVTLFGNHPYALRIPAFLAGVAVVPATYAVARAIYGSRVALIAAALVASSGILVLYATNARGYSLVVLAFLLLLLLAIRLMRGATRDTWIAFAVVAALGLWTVPTMLYPLGCVAVWFALNALVDGRRSELRQLGIALVVAFGIAALLYWPVFSKEGVAAVTRNKFVTPAPWLDFFNELPGTMRQMLTSWSLGISPLASLPFLAFALLALRRHGALSQFRIGIPLAAFVWSAWLLVVNHRAPFPRTWLWFLPIVAALAGAGLVRALETSARFRPLVERRIPLVAGGVAVALAFSVVASFGVLLTRDTGTYREAEQAVTILKGVVRPGDRILAGIPTNGPLEYYLHRQGVDRRYLYAHENSVNRVFAVVDAGEGQTLRHLASQSFIRDTVWGEPTEVATLQASAIVMFQRRNAPSK